MSRAALVTVMMAVAAVTVIAVDLAFVAPAMAP